MAGNAIGVLFTQYAVLGIRAGLLACVNEKKDADGYIARSKLKRGIHLLPAWMWMKHYAVVAGSLVFVVLFAIIASAGFDAINVHYTTVFNRSLSQSAAVEFRFDRVADLPDASVHRQM